MDHINISWLTWQIIYLYHIHTTGGTSHSYSHLVKSPYPLTIVQDLYVTVK